jgi:hypothetical protein
MSRGRKTGGSVFGLALVAMLLFGAVAASGAQALAWHIGGKTLAERGETKAPYTMSGGTLSVDLPEWGATINCDNTTGSGYLSGQDKGTGTLKATKCSLSEQPWCQVDPIQMTVDLGLVEDGGTGVVETLTPHYNDFDLNVGGEECSWPYPDEDWTIWSQEGALGAEADSSKTSLSLTGSSAYQIQAFGGSIPVSVSLGGSLQQSYANNPTLSLDVW